MITPANARRPRHAFVSRCLAAATSLAAVGVWTGCDDGGDRLARQSNASATAIRANAGVPSPEVVSQLQSVASQTRVSPGVIQARHALGLTKFDLAQHQANNVRGLESSVSGVVNQIASAAARAQTGAALANAYLGLDPKQAIAKFREYAAQLQGQGGTGGSTVTLDAVSKEQARLQGEIASREAKVAELAGQRDGQLRQAGEVSGQADRERGESRLTLVRQVADFRQQGAELSRQISSIENELAQLRADLEVQNAVQQRLDSAVKGFELQATTMADGWKSVASEAEKLNDVSRRTLNANEADSVKSLAAALSERLKASDEERAQAETAFKEAIDAFDSAGTFANQFVTALAGGRGTGGAALEQDAWDAQAKLFAADRINLDKAVAQLALANFRMDHLRFLALQSDAAAALDETGRSLGVPAPAPLESAKLKAALAEAAKSADEAYNDAFATIDGVRLVDADLASLKVRRDTAGALALYGRAQLARFATARGVAPELAENVKLIEDAKAAVGESRAGGTILPRLPDEITPPPAPVAPAEGAPAEGAAAPAAAE